MSLFKHRIFIPWFVVFIFILTGVAQGAIIRVPKDQKSIQKGLDVARKGDTVRVSKGHYTENITLKKGVTVEGGWDSDYAKRDIVANETIIDGKSKGGWVVFGADQAVLDGFTIINGTRIEKGDSTVGAGVHCASTSPTIRNNTIRNNAPAGIFCSGSASLIENNQIYANEEAGIYMENGCSLQISRNQIRNNKQAGIASGGMVSSQFDIRNNRIHDNAMAGIEGKAATGKIYNNIIYNNKSSGIRCIKVPLDMINNTIIGSGRSGIVVEDPTVVPVIKNNIFAFNEDSGIRAAGKGYAYNLFYANNMTEGCNPNYLWCVRRQYGGYEDEDSFIKKHDIIADPLFVDPANHNYRLRPKSPAIDGGDPDAQYNDKHFPPSLGEAVNDLGAYGGPYAIAEKKKSNNAPVTNAGTGQKVYTGKRVRLNGKESFDPDGDALSYQWTFSSRPSGSKATLKKARTARPSFKADVSGKYIIELLVKDRHGTAGKRHSVQVEAISNHPPEANAGEIMSQVYPGDNVTLYGGGSKDPDGDHLTFRWELVFKPQESRAALSDPSTAGPSFVVDALGSYAVTLVVNDGKVDSEPDTLIISTKHSAPERIRHVPGEYPSIQAAIDAAEPGDEIIVAKGIYKEAIVLDKNVNLTGVDWPTIDGGGKDGDVNTIMIPYLGDRAGKIEGFIITGGGRGGMGHGINVWDSSPEIVGNKIMQNHHNAIGVHGRAVLTEKARIHHNHIFENTIGIGNGRGSKARIYENHIYRNRVVGIGSRGQAEPQIERNYIYDNRIGVGAREVAAPYVEGNHIYDNVVGVAISPISTVRRFAHKDIVIKNNLIINNHQLGINITSFNLSDVHIINNTVAFNNQRFDKRDRAGGIVLGYPFQGTFNAFLENNIVMDNQTGGIINYTGTELFPGPGATLKNDANNVWNSNDVPKYIGCVPGIKSISKDPLFTEGPIEINGGYFLSQRSSKQKKDSPCVDAGSSPATKLGLHKKTTRTDKTPDAGKVDLGYHYPVK